MTPCVVTVHPKYDAISSERLGEGFGQRARKTSDLSAVKPWRAVMNSAVGVMADDLRDVIHTMPSDGGSNPSRIQRRKLRGGGVHQA